MPESPSASTNWKKGCPVGTSPKVAAAGGALGWRRRIPRTPPKPRCTRAAGTVDVDSQTVYDVVGETVAVEILRVADDV